MTSLEDRLIAAGRQWQSELRTPSLDSAIDQMPAVRRRPPAWLVSAACIAVTLMVAALVIVLQRTDHPRVHPSEPLDCPHRSPVSASGALEVPSSPRGIAASQSMVPKQTPDNVIICRYGQADGAGAVSWLPLSRGLDLVGPLDGVATDLSWLPKAVPGQQRHCHEIHGASDDRYLLGLNYPLGEVWVSVAADPGHCIGSTNGVFASTANLGVQVAASFAAKRWTAPPQDSVGGCSGSPYGRLGQSDAMVPDGALYATICTTHPSVTTKRVTRGVSDLVAALNALPISPTYQEGCYVTNEALSRDYVVKFSYLVGPAVIVQVMSYTRCPVWNGTIMSTQQGATVDVINSLLR